ncbi:MAG: MoaD/ThiS family protein [Dehalococcoidales bacterium]
MKIKVELLGLPTLSSLIGKKSEVEITGETVTDLVAHLAKRHGHKVRQILLDQKGDLDSTIQVIVNEESFMPREEISLRTLQDGDKVIILLLAGGG